MPNATVLIVEDERAACNVLELRLRQWGFHCIACHCISDAVAAFEKLRLTEGPKIILLDWLVPAGQKDVERARALDARKSELCKRLSSMDGEKLASDEVAEIRRKLNDLDDEIERMLLAEGGQNFLHIIGDQPHGFGVIIMSGNPAMISIPAAVETIRILPKPLNPHQLREAIQECCERLEAGS